MPRLIAIEEAFQLPELADEAKQFAGSGDAEALARRLVDVSEERLAAMDAAGVDYAVLSLTAPGPQGRADAGEAADLARGANDHLAAAVARHPDRFGGFAALSMHDGEVAAAELRRAVGDLEMLGAIVNDAQESPDGQLFYDDRRFDPFWAALEELDVPVYIHPRKVFGGREQSYAGMPWLQTAAWGFAAGVAIHTLRIVTSGVFDRFPRAQLVIGHMGEHIPYDLWRIDHHLPRQKDVPARRPVRDYFRSNVHITTSGHFHSPSLRLAIEEIGAERVMFSVDYPYENNEEATRWFADAPLSEEERRVIGSGNAERLLRLPPAANPAGERP